MIGFPKMVAIFGAGGHGRVIGTTLRAMGKHCVFLDDSSQINGVVGGQDKLRDQKFLAEYDIIIGIGDCRIRHGLSHMVELNGGRLFTFIHPSAVVNPTSEVGAGSAIMAGAVVGPHTLIGKACVVNICASIAHDCIIGDGAQLADGVRLGGNIKIGEDTLLGLGSVVLPKKNIGPGCVIGAGSVVTKDVPHDEVWYGNPASFIRKK